MKGSLLFTFTQTFRRSLLTCQILIINWIVCHIIDIFLFDMSVKTIFSNIGYISICLIGTVFLLFAFYYTKVTIVQNKLFKTILFIPSAILYFIKITDPFFHLFFDKFYYQETVGGLGFYVTVVYNYILMIISICLILVKNRKSFKEKTDQMILISLSAVIPLVINFLSVTDIFTLDYDFTPISFSITSILIFFAIYKFEFVSISPYTVKHLLSSISEAVLITNKFNKVTYVNNVMKDSFGLDDNCIQKDSKIVTQHLLTKIKDGNTELCRLFNGNDKSAIINLYDNKYLRVKKIEVFSKEKIISNVFIFSDLTHYYEFTAELSEKNRALEKSNKQLARMNIVEKILLLKKNV